MNPKRGWLAMLLVLSVVLSLFIIPTYAANDVATLKLTDIQAMPGEQFTTTLYVVDGSEIADFDVELLYDTDVVQLISAKANKNVDGGVTVNTGTPGVINVNYSNVENTYEEMPILDIVFKVDEEAGPESYEFFRRNPADTKVATRLDGDRYLDVPIVCDFSNLSLYASGDIDLNGMVEIRDVTHLRRYLARLETLTDYQLLMADAYYDNDVNVRDAVYIQQKLAKFDVQLGGRANIYFYDGDGNLCATKSVVIGSGLTKIPAVPERTGYSNGVWSAKASEYVEADLSSVAKDLNLYAFYSDAPIIGDDEYEISYNLYNNDAYLQRVGVNNPNPDKYSAKDGLVLAEPEVAGYNFEGWFDGQGAGANRVTEIAKGTTGKVTLYARWTALEYTINYECDMGNIPSGTYKVNQSTTLTVPTKALVPEMSNYIFLGWTNEAGELVKTIPAGTVGAQSFTANWTSRRNQTRPTTLSDPLTVIEDTENGTILFAYELGTIENVPLYTIGDRFDARAGVEIRHSTQTSNTLSTTDAKNIAKTIEKTTTDSKTWTLSEDWNDVTSVTESYAEQLGKTVEQANEYCQTSSNTFSMTKDYGLSGSITDSSGISASLTGTQSHSDVHSVETTKSHEFNINAGLSGKIAKKVPIIGGGNYSVDAGYKRGKTKTDKDETTDAWSNTINVAASDNHASTVSASLNVGSSMSASNSVSSRQSVSQALSEVVSTEKGYGKTYSKGGSNSEAQAFATSDTSSDTYGSTLTYFDSAVTTEATEYSTNGAAVGSYRFTCAGTVHVFGVVGYDVATSSYFTYTYDVLDEQTYPFLDYSYDGTFTEYENGILPFEIPTDIYEYVNDRLTKSDGLLIDTDTGMVTGYTGSDPFVWVPSYVSIPTLSGNTNKAVKITGFEPDVFKGNTTIQGVFFGDFVTEIPDSAFEGCTSLQGVIMPGVEKIGANAFKGCTSLINVNLPIYVTDLGMNAFEGVQNVTVKASSKDVAENTTVCGAKSITLNISEIADEISSAVLAVPNTAESFVLQGDGRTFSNIKLKSDAASTTINGVVFSDCTGIPVQVSSNVLNLQFVTIVSPSYALLLTADKTNVELYGNTYISTAGDKAIVCRDMSVSISPEAVANGVSSRLKVAGNILTCNGSPDRSNIAFERGDFIQITPEEFEKYARGMFHVAFDANGGETNTSSVELVCDEAIGELPEATRTGYSFAGWFTEPEGGEQVTAETRFDGVDDVTVYAHWTVLEYTANWNTGTGFTITVNRTGSPYANAELGAISSGAPVYYGDILSVSYAAATGYTLSASGEKNITVTRGVTPEDIYASATPNSYTYNAELRSSNGTYLSSFPVTNAYGTTNTVTPYAITGYTTPAAQSVKWDSTTPKTITFIYVPSAVSAQQQFYSDTWWYKSSTTYIWANAYVEIGARRADSVDVRITWTNTLSAGYYGYAQWFNAVVGGVAFGDWQIANTNSFGYGGSGTRTASVTTGWFSVPAAATTTSVFLYGSWWDQNNLSKTFEGTFQIPAY